MILISAQPCYVQTEEIIAMLEFLGIAVIIGTIILVGRQRANDTGTIIEIILCGYMLISLLAKMKY